jgi:CRISPR-associated protein Cas1
MDVDHIVLLGYVSITPQALHLCCEAGIPVVHCSTGYWFYGMTHGNALRNAFDKAAQFHVVDDAERRLALARAFVSAKISNQRTLIRRNSRPLPTAVVDELRALARRPENAKSVDELRGIEGTAARIYFTAFSELIRPPDGALDFAFQERNRRPPRDPVNALLSFGYAMLAKECTIALLAVGLDPHWGFYHSPRHGRPALALDLMEEFRPLIVDSAVVTAINTGMVKSTDFTRSRSGCVLKPAGRKTFIRALEARLDQLVTHPIFEYRLNWRSTIRLQARLLTRSLRGDVPEYRGMATR